MLLGLQLEEEVVVFRADLPGLKLPHDPLILLIIVGGVISKAGLPVLVGSWSHHKFVLLMKLALETQLAHLHVLAHNALESGFEYECSLAAVAFEAALILGLLLGLDFHLFGPLLTELLCLLPELFQSVGAPVRPA